MMMMMMMTVRLLIGLHRLLFGEIISSVTQCAFRFGIRDILGHKSGQVMRMRGRHAKGSYKDNYFETLMTAHIEQ